MISDAKEIIERLNSPSDWAVVGGAATVGLVADGTVNILPFPFFSPGMCALAAAGAALSIKRGAEASLEQWHLSRRRTKLRREARRCIETLSVASDPVADDLKWRLELDGDDMQALEELVREARGAVKMRAAYSLRDLEFAAVMQDIMKKKPEPTEPPE